MVPENLNTQQIVTYWGFKSLLSKPLLEQQVGFHATGTETGIQGLFLAAPGAALTTRTSSRQELITSDIFASCKSRQRDCFRDYSVILQTVIWQCHGGCRVCVGGLQEAIEKGWAMECWGLLRRINHKQKPPFQLSASDGLFNSHISTMLCIFYHRRCDSFRSATVACCPYDWRKKEIV